MFENKALQDLNEYFQDLNLRRDKGVYFYRINGWSEQIGKFISIYYEAARKRGVIIEGKIPNPDKANLSYYDEMMGSSFQMNLGFINSSLQKWLPRMNEFQRNNVAVSIYDTLDEMRREGKNDNILRNTYIKFMCWLYYKFERIVNMLGENHIPKILYEGNVSNYELKILAVLSKAGCDIVLLQYGGDAEYLKIDHSSKLSNLYTESGMIAFPQDFSIKKIREELVNQQKQQRLYGIPPAIGNCTNAWISGSWEEDILTSVHARGKDKGFFCNAFMRISGVEDKLTYVKDLFQLQLKIKSSERNLVVVNHVIAQPDMDEIAQVRRSQYNHAEHMIQDLSANLKYSANIELERLMRKAFVDTLLSANERNKSLNKLTNQAVYLICWLRRYQKELFVNWKLPEISVFIYLGGCRTESEALFLKLLSRLPVDVLILVPDLNKKCILEDKFLYEVNFSDSLTVDRYPTETAEVKVGTAAYHAERELDTLMYQDSGIYRSMQHSRALTISLQTMYEEIAILWDQELKYRPNFSVTNEAVQIPVIFAKVSGVKDGDTQSYWLEMKKLITPDVLVYKNAAMATSTDANPVKPFAVEFFKNGKLLKQKIKSHKAYQYGVLREEIQDYILDKLQLLIDQKSIRGTFENGAEYTITSTVLNLNKNIIRMIQRFDFTKKNPKILYINTSERVMTLEESIIVAFLNLAGFDVVFFIPTGYQNVEKHFTRTIVEEHQIGEYMYDLQIPDFNNISSGVRHFWREKIFKRGN